MSEGKEPGSPEEAWYQRSLEVRAALRERSDEELLDMARRGAVDMTGGLWDVIKERDLGENLVRELMTFLVTPEEEAVENFSGLFRGACTLMDVTGFPAEWRDFMGDKMNQTAARISRDHLGEPARQEELKKFWVDFKRHCEDLGMLMDWEPPWPETFKRYRVEVRLVSTRSNSKPVSERSLTDQLRNVYRVCLDKWEEEERPDGFSLQVESGEEGMEKRVLVMRFDRADLLIRVEYMCRQIGSEEWRLPMEVLIVYESDAASVARQNFPMFGDPTAIFYVYNFHHKSPYE